MKRSAAKADLNEEALQQPLRRSTRSLVRDAKLEQQRLEEEDELEKIRLQRAEDLTATALLQALPLILTSGFLYKHEIRSAALVSKSWKSIWVEAQHELPEYCQVEIKARHFEKAWPTWVKIRRLQHAFPTPEFSRTIFEKLCDLKVAAEKTERKKQRPVTLSPNGVLTFSQLTWWFGAQRLETMVAFILISKPLNVASHGAGVILVKRFEGGLSASTTICSSGRGLASRSGKKIYNWEPLWECEIFDDIEGDDAEEMPAPPVVVAPPPLPPPGPGRIDFYFQPRA